MNRKIRNAVSVMAAPLIDPYLSFNGSEYFPGIKPHPVLKNQLRIPDILNVLSQIAVDQDQVGLFTGAHRTDLFFPVEVNSSVQGTDPDGLFDRKATLDQQL